MLDVLSNGRMDFGVGKGGTETEAGAFDVDIPDIDAQLETSFRMIPEMWASDVYSFESELIRVPERRIHPKARPDAATPRCRWPARAKSRSIRPGNGA